MTQTHTPSPCPFCGTAPSIHGAPDMGYRIICRHDGSILGECSVSDNTKEATIEAWNRRAPDASQAAEIARLRKALENSLRVYVQLAESGDCGFWNPEEEAHVKQARAALEPRS